MGGKGTIASVLVLIGAVLMVVSLLSAWYSLQESGSGATLTANEYLGSSAGQNGTIQFSCTGGVSCPGQTSYTQAHQNNTGNLAVTGYFLVLAGLVTGLLGAILGFASRSRPSAAKPAMVLGVLALILALATPVLMFAELPGAISKDQPGATGSGPWGSFFGSTSNYSGGPPGVSATWGPGLGWYFSVVAFVLFLVGVILWAKARKAPAETGSTAATYTCPTCGASFTSQADLEGHARTAHPPA